MFVPMSEVFSFFLGLAVVLGLITAGRAMARGPDGRHVSWETGAIAGVYIAAGLALCWWVGDFLLNFGGA